MSRVDDMMLMAYADGELTAEDAQDIERSLASDPKLRERLRQFVDSAAWARAALSTEGQGLVPERLSQLFAANDVVPRVPTWSRRVAMAACVGALAVGLSFGWSAQRLSVGDDGSDMQAQIAKALETLPNGEVLRFAAARGKEGGIAPVRTFINDDGRFCREFALSRNEDVVLGLACRTPEGTWPVETLLLRGEDAIERL